MPIPIYGCRAEGGVILKLDDEGVVRDGAAANGTGGTAYTARFTTETFDNGLSGGYSRFRRFVQHVHPDSDVDVDITPVRDGSATGQTLSRDIAVGGNGVLVAPLDVGGTEFQVEVVVSEFAAPVEVGESEQYVVPRRSER